jgi:hypothetical protein
MKIRKTQAVFWLHIKPGGGRAELAGHDAIIR